MSSKNTNSNKNRYVEFSPEKDIFEKTRQRGTNRWILAHLFSGSNKINIIIVFFTTILAAIISSATMIVVGFAIEEFMNGNEADLLFFVFLILLLSIMAPVLRLINFMLREVLAQRIERDVRREFYINLLGKSQSFHDQQKIGDLMARATNDVRMLNFLISPAMSLIIESFTALIIPTIFIAIFFPTQLIITPIIFSILFLIYLRYYSRKIGPVTAKMRMEFGRMNASLNETLSGIEVVKGSTQEIFEMNKYSKIARNYRDAYVEQGVIQAKYLPILFLALAMTAGLAHAIFLYFEGLMTTGQVIAYIGLLTLLRFPTFISMFVFAILRLAISGANRLLEIMNRDTEIDENVDGIHKTIDGKIKFENVSFIYPEGVNPVLKNVSLEIQPGQTVAVVGTTGSGKTTLTKLISRLYDVNKGKILIDDIDIKDFALKSLRNQISYIEQDVFLFSTKIVDNISFGRVSSISDVKKVAKQAQAHDFISNLPNGYQSEVGERGVQLSGGERQRIAIARAFLTDPRILILDDSTSAIDSETEDKIQKAIQNILKDRTTFLITHRLSQIRWADLILVLKKGEIVASGDHKELLRTSPEYKKIFIKRFDVGINELLKEGD